MTDTTLHATHPRIATRLKRADGHLRHVIEMIEGGRPCVEIAQQLQAVERAIVNAKRELIHDHIDHCLETEAADIAEFRTISRYL
ncbi:metal-sensing transcriptional repressor [Limimaricola pyoseonensis]|uniref:DNA-binding transcriptional regulator, FrmR family n=1 Tax=Limimaricola pyoseonensis TaxID=521013 RepID=A0A1G6ZZ75_9RHOB|nr:metal-sensing transcriptional repressor [Limimaricola pyoseonensis]SDE07820.1 hypothetical protein NreA [Limimaricola pyoseonensis]